MIDALLDFPASLFKFSFFELFIFLTNVIRQRADLVLFHKGASN